MTLFGISIEASLLHPSNIELVIDVMLSGIIADDNLEQPQKIPSPIVVTLLGITIEVKPVQELYMYIFEYQLFVVNTVEK